MSASREELIKFIKEAEANQDFTAAGKALDMIEAMDAQQPKVQPTQDYSKPNPDAGINPIKGNIEQTLAGATFGFSDELQSLVGAATTAGQTDMPFTERYKMIRDQMRADRQQFINQEGMAAYVPELIGGAVTGLAGLSKAGTLKGAAAIGALEGGIAGAGYADAENFASPETAINAGAGAGAGAVTGFALPLVGRYAKKGVAAVGDAISDRLPNITGRTGRIAAEEAVTGVRPDMAARYKPKAPGSPKLSRDTLAVKAMDQLEIPEPMVRSMQDLTPADKKAGIKMLNIIKIGKTNSAFADANRPGKILGDTLKENIDFLSSERKKAGIQLKRLIETKLKGQPVSVDDALQGFAQKLDDLGVTLNTSQTGKITPDFDGALKLNRNDRTPIREAIRKINRVIESGRPTADTVHDLKRALDNEIPWDSASKMTPEGEDLLKSLRGELNEALQETFPGYKEVNGKLSDIIGSMEDISDMVGKKYNPDSPNADEYLGQELRKLVTNYNKRVPMTDAINQVEDVARKYGLQSDSSVRRQASMLKDMEDFFEVMPRGGFDAGIKKGTNAGITEVAKRSIRGDKGALLDRGLDFLQEATSNVDSEKQFEILKQLLQRQ